MVSTAKHTLLPNVVVVKIDVGSPRAAGKRQRKTLRTHIYIHIECYDRLMMVDTHTK